MKAIFPNLIIEERFLENVKVVEQTDDDGNKTFAVIAGGYTFDNEGVIDLSSFDTEAKAKAFLKKVQDGLVASENTETIDFR